jgi:hypothetical protein
MKYSTKGRSPWGFTFSHEEQVLLEHHSKMTEVVIGLVCGADGVAAVRYQQFRTVVQKHRRAIHLSCARSHGEHYLISGPDGSLRHKVAPGSWQKILSPENS